MAESSRLASGMYDGPELTKENLSFFWNSIPKWLRKGLEVPENTVDYIMNLPRLNCDHPRQAAVALGDETQRMEWDASIEQMEQWATHACPAFTTPGAIPANTESKLFRVTDIPELKDTKEYEHYRNALQRFLRANADPAPQEFGRALERILQNLTAPSARIASATWDVTKLIEPTWKETTERLFKSFDEKFQDNNLLEKTQVTWYQTKLKDNDDINDFFLRYEAAADQYLLAQQRLGLPKEVQISPAVVTTRLIQILPPYLRNALKLRASSKVPKKPLETLTLQELRFDLDELWRYMPRPAAKGHNTQGNFQTGNTRNGPAQKGQNEVRTMGCGMVCSYDTSPPVPIEARGSIYPDQRNPQNDPSNLARLHFVLQNNLCKNCRRGPHEHKTVGAIFSPAKQLTRTRRTRNTEEPPRHYNTVPPPPERLTIEAPPSRPTTPLQ